jgi:hypothetical protein
VVTKAGSPKFAALIFTPLALKGQPEQDLLLEKK